MHYLIYYLFICLCCLFLIATVRCRRLRESPGAQRARPWAAASGRARQVTLDHIDPKCSLSFSSIHIGMHALILYLSLILRIWVYTWLVKLRHAVMSVVQVFSSFVMLSLAWVFVSHGRHPSRCDLTLVRIDAVVWARLEWWRWLDFVSEVPCHARICYGPNLRSRPPRITCATMCPVWNNLLTN
jgi:hypothetical protein